MQRMSKARNERAELPTEFKSLEEAGLFWDTHSSADYEAFMVPVSLEVDAPLDRFYVAVARELAQKLSEYRMKHQLHVVDRNLQLTQRVMAYLMTNPNMFESLPDQFELVVLPDDDPELRAYNLDLLDRYGSEARPVVFARLSMARLEATPQVFAQVLQAT